MINFLLVRLPIFFMAEIFRDSGTVLSHYFRDLGLEAKKTNRECQHHLFYLSNRLILDRLLEVNQANLY